MRFAGHVAIAASAWAVLTSAIYTTDLLTRSKDVPAAVKPPPKAISVNEEILRHKVILATEFAFEKANNLTTQFDNCADEDKSLLCTASTSSGGLVTYRCDTDRCIVECASK